MVELNAGRVRKQRCASADAVRSAFYKLFIERKGTCGDPLADSHLDLRLDVSMKIGAAGHQEVDGERPARHTAGSARGSARG
ncbi:MAG: hypothetical protein MZV70_18115 [Desulfobacterales bacterium]|nr:hypothetical protein [Desulfobacterales bacterium]